MSSEIRDKIWEIFKQCFDESDMEGVLNKTVNEAGVSSLNFVKFIVAIENEFNIEVEDKYLDFSQYTTIKDIFNMVEKLVS